MPNDLAHREFKNHESMGQTGPEGSEMDLRQVYELLRSGVRTILAIVAGFLLLGGLYYVLASPTYKAEGLVEVEQDTKSGSMSQMSDMSSLLLGTPVETEAEIQILQSHLVLNQVIDKLNLLVNVRPAYFPIIGKPISRWLNAKEPVAVPSLFRSYAWGGEQIDVESFEVPDELLDTPFRLVAKQDGYVLLDPDRKKVLEGKIGVSEQGNTSSGPLTILVRNLIAIPGTQFKLRRYPQQQALDSLLNLLDVEEKGKQSGVIGVAVKGPTPAFVQDVINDIEEAYLRQNVERRSADAQQSLEFLDRQLPKLKEQVAASQAKLNGYQQTHGSVDVTQETQLVLQQSVDLETKRLELEQQREELTQRFKPQHPVVKAIDQQLVAMGQEQEKIKRSTEKLPTTQQDVFSLTRDLDVNTQLYTDMMNTIQELQVAKAGTIGNVRIVDYALLPFERHSPKLIIVLPVAFVLGLIIGIAYVFVQRSLLRGVHDPAEVERQFGLNTYAMIPYSQKQVQINRAMRQGKKGGGSFILATQHGDDLAIESLRSLRTSLHFALLDSPNNVVMLTGPTPGLGKSFIAINLGALLATSGKRVVVVDMDLRRGHLHRYIGVSHDPGVTDFIAGDAGLDRILQKTEVDRLHLIPRGTTPPNPSELLLHEKTASLIKQLSELYDLVILDTPPVLPVTDAAIVGQLAGCTLLILKSAEHPLPEIEESLKRLASSGIRVRGALFNQVGFKPGSYGYRNYGYTYYKYES